MTRVREDYTVPVNGGDLVVSRWSAGADAPVVLAAHGITANALAWTTMAAELDEVTLIAPDLRGRARSGALPGPYGIPAHVDDLIAVLDHAGVAGPVPIVGHSMGGFVAALTALRHPDRFAAAVLVDGGLAFPPPENIEISDSDAVLDAVIGPAIQRLTEEFADRAAYHDFFRRNPAVRDYWNDTVESYVDLDLVGDPPHLHSSCSEEAIRTDGRQLFLDRELQSSIERLTVPSTLLWAPRGMFDQEGGLYPAELIDTVPAHVRTVLVPDTNHYTITLSPHGAAAVAEPIRAALRAIRHAS